MKALVIEDNTASRILLEKILQTQGHSVKSVSDGQEGIEAYLAEEFDMVFLDWMLPRLNGLQVCRKIKRYDIESGKRSYVIMVTTKNSKEDIMQALEAGVDDFISKPINSNILASRINIGLRAKLDLPTDAVMILEEEHKVILRMADVLQTVAELMNVASVSPKILNWFKSTAILLDMEVHHRKEDQFILMFLERAISTHGESPHSRIFSRTSLKTIEEEHEELTVLLGSMQAQLDSYSNGEPGSKEILQDTIFRYLDLIRNHVAREEQFLFPLTKKYLDISDFGTLVGRFSEIEDEVGTETLDRRTEQLVKMEIAIEKAKKQEALE